MRQNSVNDKLQRA